MAFCVGADVERLDFLTHRGERAVRVGSRDADEPLRRAERKPRKQDAVDQAEDGGVGADPERERQDRDRRVPRIASQGAYGVAHVLNEGIDRVHVPRVAAPLLRLLDAAEAAQDGAPGLGPIESTRHALFDLTLDVVRDLVIEILFDLLTLNSERHRSGPECNQCSNCMADSTGALQARLRLTTWVMAAESLAQFSDSFSSCRRPGRLSA